MSEDIVTRGDMPDDAADIGPCTCGAEVFASLGAAGVFHAEPICAEFAARTANDYLVYLRRSRGVTDEMVSAMAAGLDVPS